MIGETETILSKIPNKLFIGGKWMDALNGAEDQIVNPATGKVIAHVARGGSEETKIAIKAAYQAFQSWSHVEADQRAMILRRIAKSIEEHADDLAMLMTLEQGKPVSQAKGEVLAGAEGVLWCAEELRRLYGQTIPGPKGHLFMVQREPIGVCAAITPWNFPSLMITRKISPAIAAGNTVVLKPSPETPLSAIALVQLFSQAGLPNGVVNLVTGDAVSIGKTLMSSDIVRKIAFTGSTAVGQMLFGQAAKTVKKISFELGGNAPFIVFDDAPIDRVVSDLVSSKFRNNGQVCTAPNRIFVHRKILQTFLTKLIPTVKTVRVGNGLEKGIDAGPLIREDALIKVDRQITDAVEKGARVETGGKRLSHGEFANGHFYSPTVLSGVTQEMKIYSEETFGPVIPVISFKDTDKVIAMANDTSYGLASYFYTKNLARIAKVSQGLQYGMVGVNSNAVAFTQAPFGGVKHSGIGRENGCQGLGEYVNTKFINLNYQ